MENQETTQTPSPLQWKWVWVGVVFGAVLVTSFVALASSQFHNPYVPTLIASLCFVITGIIVGYKSPGITIREAAASGVILMVFTLLVLTFGFNITLSPGYWIFALALGFFLSMLGAWVGEQLQGTLATASSDNSKMSLPWVATGVVIGFLLNNLSVFILFAVFHFGVTQILVSLGLSFVVTGIVTGYRSPGVTIKEAAVAGIVLVVVNFISVYLGFSAWLPLGYIVVALIVCFLLSLVGGWVGEILQSRMEQQSAND
jgi:hypothetical protein